VRSARARYGPLVMDTDRPLIWTWNQEPFWNRVDGESKDVRPCSAWTLTNRPYEQRPSHGLDQVWTRFDNVPNKSGATDRQTDILTRRWPWTLEASQGKQRFSLCMETEEGSDLLRM